MTKNELLKMAEDPRFIEGIYDYCDRWCERCPLTSRCLTYAMEQSLGSGTTPQDVNSDAFWKQIESAFQLAQELITDLAKEQGLDVSELDGPTQTAENPRPAANQWGVSNREAQTSDFTDPDPGQDRQTDAIRLAGHYGQMVNDWFDSHDSLFQKKEAGLNCGQEIGLAEESLQTEFDSITDAVAVVRWYQHQIFVKLRRASRRADFDLEDPQENEELAGLLQDQSNGSAKVALVGIERSQGAWLKLRNSLTDDAGSILSMLVHLDRLLRKTEEAFPQARNFCRPGFDTGAGRYE
jgi:post-segregation antitoxin (ccd killing protein)